MLGAAVRAEPPLPLPASCSTLGEPRRAVRHCRSGTPTATPTDTATTARPPRRCSTVAAPTTAPSTVSHELLNSKHKSSSLADIARTAAFGHKEPRERPSGKCPREDEGRARCARCKSPRIRQKQEPGACTDLASNRAEALVRAPRLGLRSGLQAGAVAITAAFRQSGSLRGPPSDSCCGTIPESAGRGCPTSPGLLLPFHDGFLARHGGRCRF